MEAIQQMSNESFSHGWLNNAKHALEFLEESLSRSFDALDATSFIEMDLDFFSMRWTDSLDFNFSHPGGVGDASLAPAMNGADQIFFNGRLLPLHLVNQGPIASPDSVLLPPSKSSPCQSESSDFSSYPDSTMTPGRFGNKESDKSPAKILKKYLYFLVPLYKKVKKLKMISSKAPRRFDCSSRRSCRRMSNVGLTADDRRRPVNRVFDVEAASSIHDAVLHCKKSNGSSLAKSG